ncbi:MAG: FKBP-type peptidyl-prolyl cis-trans isomerase [Cyanobacteriota bacterium]|nr:FKBP-type peptidyl-prolyl cis-trans isomerase [Cyanobacteriota bacterium]
MAFASLEIVPLRTGLGRQIAAGDLVQVYYDGRLTTGALFDRNYDFAAYAPVSGRAPFSLEVGAGQVIQGWEQALPDLSMGDIAELRIPANLAYGATARPGIPANSDLIFTVMPVKINGVELTYGDLGLQAPEAPVLVDVDGVSVAGSEQLSADATPTLEFLAAEGSTVSVFRDGVSVGEATEDPDSPGRFQFTSTDLPVGRHAFAAQASYGDLSSIAPLAPLIGPVSQPFSLVRSPQPATPSPPDPLIEGNTPAAPDPIVDSSLPPIPRFEPETLRSRLDEGDRLITRVATNLSAGTEVTWRLRGRGIDADDFSRGALEGQSRVRRNGSLVIHHRVAEDFLLEGMETARVQLLPEVGGTQRQRAVTVGRVKIADTSRELPLGYDPTDPWATVSSPLFADWAALG